MRVNEMFVSLQGEGVNRGKPSIFLRFSGCNLRCGFCDSTYANTPNTDINYASIVKFVLSNPETKHFVITGGEPLIQQKAIIKILNRFKQHTFEIETNGTKNVCDDLLVLSIKRNSLYNVSPKFRNSGNKPELCVVNNRFFNELTPLTIFKFVVSSYEDIMEINKFVETNHIEHNRVYLMPECTKLGEMIEKGKGLVYPCIKNGYNLTTREQLIWNVR